MNRRCCYMLQCVPNRIELPCVVSAATLLLLLRIITTTKKKEIYSLLNIYYVIMLFIHVKENIKKN